MSLDSKWSFPSATMLNADKYGMCMTTKKKEMKIICKPLHKASYNNWSVSCKIWDSKCMKTKKKTSHTVSSVHFMAMRAPKSTLPYAILSSCRFHKNKKNIFAFTTQWTEQMKKRKKEKTKIQTKKKLFLYQSRRKMWNKAWVRVKSINVSYFSKETKLESFFFILYNLN